MGGDEYFSAFARALADLSRWMSTGEIPYVLIGGLASSLLGEPRLTRDIDILGAVPDSDWQTFVNDGNQFGFAPRIADCIEFARQSQVLLLEHNASQTPVDFVCASIQFEIDMLARGQIRTVAGIPIRVPAVEDLIIMKAIAQRPKDLEDIAGIARTALIDWPRVISVLREFSQILDDSEIVSTIEKLRRQLGGADDGAR